MRISDWSSDVCSSDRLGQETVVFESMSRATDAEETGISFGSQHVGRPLLPPDEVRTLREDLQLLFLAGQRPILAPKLRFLPDRQFAWKFDKAYGISTLSKTSAFNNPRPARSGDG